MAGSEYRGSCDLAHEQVGFSVAHDQASSPHLLQRTADGRVRFAEIHRRYGPLIKAWTEAEIDTSEFGRMGASVLGDFVLKLGQRIEAFAVDAWLNGEWKEIAAATSIGPNRLIRLPGNVTTEKVRLRITKSPVSIALSDFGLFAEPALPTR